MASVNIGGSNEADAAYRYKMPALVTKVEGRGNGVKTVVVNLVDVARALRCEAAYPLKFMGAELGASCKFESKSGRATLRGRHDARCLAGLLDRFIRQFILCPTCSLPETKLYVKRGVVKARCAACGHDGGIASRHKLVRHIAQHPPEATGARQRKTCRRVDVGVERSEDEGAVVWHTDTSDDAVRARKKAEFADTADTGSGTTDHSPDAVLRAFVAGRERTVNETLSELRRIQLARGLDDTQRTRVLLRGLVDLTEPANKVPRQFKRHARVFAATVVDDRTAGTLLACLEEALGDNNAALMPHVLKALYDHDALEEEHILAWFESPPEASFLVPGEVAVRLRRKAATLVQWLKTAAEESSDSETA